MPELPKESYYQIVALQAGLWAFFHFPLFPGIYNAFLKKRGMEGPGRSILPQGHPGHLLHH